MFSLAYDGQQYKINFKYDTVPMLFDGELDTVERRITECQFSRKDEQDGKPFEVLLWTSTAVCNACDNFSKRIGRKVALAKLLKVMGADRDFRVAVWDEYFKHTKRV